MPALKRIMIRVEVAGAPKKDKKQIPFGNDRKKSKDRREYLRPFGRFVFAVAFLSVIPEGNLLFEF